MKTFNKAHDNSFGIENIRYVAFFTNAPRGESNDIYITNEL